MARPSNYSPEIAAEICVRIADGRSLRSVCKDADMPDKATVCRWLALHEDFQTRYVHAHDCQLDCIADDIMEIADDSSKDYKLIERGGQTFWIVDLEVIQRARLRTDARKWMLAKMAPKKYGNRIQIEHSGPRDFRALEVMIVDSKRP
jgi:hypothetical protein